MKTTNRLRVIQPQPFRTLDAEEDSGTIRRHDCRYYDRCEHIACVADWPGFTCSDCPGYDQQAPLAKERDFRASIRGAAEILNFTDDTRPVNDNDETAPLAAIKWAA